MSDTISDPNEQQEMTRQPTPNVWQIEIYPSSGMPDRIANSVADSARDMKLSPDFQVAAARGFLIQGDLNLEQAEKITQALLVDSVVETHRIGIIDDPSFEEHPKLASSGEREQIYVLPLPGVTDPEAESTLNAIKLLGFPVDAVTTFKKYWTSKLPTDQTERLHKKVLHNESIERIMLRRLDLERLDLGNVYQFEKKHVGLAGLSDEQLVQLSQSYQLSLSLTEMQVIRDHFADIGRSPVDVELETVAQTWSEHCSHKTLAGRIAYTDDSGTRHFENMLKETIFAATVKIREDLGNDDWCVSVFKDNAGIVRFDDQHNVSFKVETHNRPSALEPYGGANTGIGGVIRDTLGTGLGAKPVCNTDVFCFADPETAYEDLPPGVMHPRQIMKGVVSGVRDYGNRMGIPTVNGAVYFDQRYIGNPLVFCGNVGLLPQDMSFKEAKPGDLIVSIGGKTGRDGIHGATFSSAELTEDSDVTSGGAVQIGDAVTEKMLMDVLLEARDRRLYSAVTDCGAGGYSSAVGEMGEKIGAEVWLDRVPLKYEGLNYTEIWISEAQERMVFSVPEEHWSEFQQLCESESVAATVIGKFEPTGRLVLKYKEEVVCDIAMNFLHDGRPPIVREAKFVSTNVPTVVAVPEKTCEQWTEDLKSILGSLNVASKHWIVHQYDHEVQAGSAIKPLVGVANDGPGDAAVVRPVISSQRGLVISCGMNPHYGDLDPYHMACSGIDEAIRNCVAVGADPSRIAILDNFCWGRTDRPETLGNLVRAAIACHDLSIVLQTPFISGKDSLHNEFSYTDVDGNRNNISIPSTLLISAMGQVEDVKQCVTMDLKSPGNKLFLVGTTSDHLGGSHWCLVNEFKAGMVPTVDAELAKRTFAQMHQTIKNGLVRSCHDLCEGGLAAAAAEMAFAGGLGTTIDAANVGLLPLAFSESEDVPLDYAIASILFSESNTRFLVEVETSKAEDFLNAFDQVEVVEIGEVTQEPTLQINFGDQSVIQSEISTLKKVWQEPLDWS